MIPHPPDSEKARGGPRAAPSVRYAAPQITSALDEQPHQIRQPEPAANKPREWIDQRREVIET